MTLSDQIKAILERELAKLDRASLANPDPLSPNEVKSLDTLIKAYRSYSSPNAVPPVEGGAVPPKQQSTQDLLNEIGIKI
jgi:hydroxyethylthiazole kinase-like sugar kinase family protein